MKKIIAMLLAVVMVLGLVACKSETKPTETTEPATEATTEPTAEVTDDTEPTDDGVTVDPYTQASAEIYNAVLGEYLAAYEAAKEATNVSERFALMAIAEAKLLESGVMLPCTTSGGNYAISRVIPNTVPYAMWGNDEYRYHTILVVDGNPITSEDRAEMKALWAELRGTGTYEAKVKELAESKGYKLVDSYNLGYSSDPKTWDVLATSRAADSEAIVMTYDGLYEYDMEGTPTPALAESYEVSEDGLTYTFHLRSGAVWVDSQGREVAPVVADDFVAGMQHMMDAQGGLEYLIQGVIVNANEYIAGEVTDFAEVGVSAPDELTVVYTLEAPCSYFTTMLGYGVFAPMSRSYYLSQGGTFGEEFDPSAESYTYGVDPDHIAYNGPFVVTNATAENTIVFSANESYWNPDNMNVHTVTWLYNDGSDPTKAYNDMKAGILSGAGLNSAALEVAKADGWYDLYHYVSATNATSYMAFNNVNRAAFVNVNDGTSVPSAQTEEDAARTNAAMKNVHFRMALNTSVDRAAYNAQTVGEELKLVSVRNSYTPGTFVSLEEEVTVDINGTATTFPAGTYYGAILQAQLDADGVAVKAWDPAADDGIGSSDGFDGWCNPEYAASELAIAVEELAAEGVEVSAENPIYLDLPYPSNNANYTNKANAFKQSVEANLGGVIIINLTECVDYAAWYYTGYYTDYGYEANYDIYDLSGWGPDYGDPSTYLDTFLPDYAGYMIKCIGIF